MPAYVPPPDLLPARVVNELGYVAAELYARLEERAAALVAAIVSEGLPAPDDLVQRQRVLRELEKAAREMVGRIDPGLAADLIGIAEAQGTHAMLAQLRMLPTFEAGSLLNYGSAGAVNALVADLQNRLEALEQRILRYPQDAYQRIIAATAPGVLTGLQGGLAAQRLAVSRFLAEGIAGFIDRSGRAWSIGTYSEMATRTAVMRASQDSAIATMQRFSGIGLVSVVSGDTACDKCGAWLGRILSTDGTPAGTYEMPHATQEHTVRVKVDSTLDEARAQGLQHPNCRCALVAYLPGLSVAGAATVYDAAMDADLQRQRELERHVRREKRKLAAATDEATPAAARRVREAQAALREHLDTTGFNRQRYREQLWFTDGAGRAPRPGPDLVYRDGHKPRPEERATHLRLQALGRDVVVLAPQRGPNGRHTPTPDLYMDGGLWEVKTITGSGATLSNRVQAASKQSSRVVVDITPSTVNRGAAMERIAHDAERYGLTEALLVQGDREYRLLDGEWIRKR